MIELHYTITEDDYIAFNLHYFAHNAPAQRTMLQTRIVTALLCVVGGTTLMYMLRLVSPLSILVYVALAVAVFFGIPPYMQSKLKKNVHKVLKNAKNKQLCSEKTMQLGEDKLRMFGGGEDSTYEYKAITRVATDTAHFYVFVDEFSALIVPFSAFASEQDKQTFYQTVTQFIEDEAYKQ